jgi:hypothetical protein
VGSRGFRKPAAPNMNRQWAVVSIVVAAGIEVATGVVLIIRPALSGWLLFGAELSAAGQALGRLTGFTLLSLALACWPGLGAERRSAVRALLIFSLLSAIFLVYLGVGSELVGPLLWPAAAVHAALTIILVLGWLKASPYPGPA